MSIISDFRAFYMPYVLRRQTDGRYLVLNRYYKPLGFTTHDPVDYERYPVLVNLPGLTPTIASRLSCRADSNLNEVYLYDDGSNPTLGKREMWAYQEKLAVLANLTAINGVRHSL